MGTVVRRRRATESLSYLLNIEVKKGKLISHSGKFVKSFCPTKAIQRLKRPLCTLTVVECVIYFYNIARALVLSSSY